ncbi:MAG TPA: 5-methyltetrahydropteroyltriglutamate--homocysteine S-methyltransferase [Castellaniella sp.]|uniref:5-methyltetrahydropteroyltriglutamate-- homocysteine S-methyltransferase n=1 Tax=Castellaniella sp. TaxID=1955812 RepID=UPI002F034C55
MTTIHNLGFPRIGTARELKRAQESYWAGKISQSELLETGRELRARHWQIQARAGLQCVPVGDFAWYDHILEWTTLLGAVPARFGQAEDSPVTLDTLFRMARGRAPSGTPAAACEMTKWFDTNYHYIVPELHPQQTFRIARDSLFTQVTEAQAQGFKARPVIPGPLTWLWLGKGDAYDAGAVDARKLDLLSRLLPVYEQVLQRLAQQGVEWVQVDEPILTLELPQSWREALATVYSRLSQQGLKLLLTTYFEGVSLNLDVIRTLPVQGLHVDLVRDPQQLTAVLAALQPQQILSLGVINGRNVWRADLDHVHAQIREAAAVLQDRLWLAPSCSLLHSPMDLALETGLDAELRSWLSFAVQKLDELRLLRVLVDGNATESDQAALKAARAAVADRATSNRIHRADVARRMQQAASIERERTPFAQRIASQQKRLALPAYPTTTIGSFPQTPEIRALRHDWRAGSLTDAAYEKAIRAEIERVVRFQEEVGLDVLVHGEPERNDMVEYFGELLAGFAFTSFGWVQSYGSRCVKPPLIFGDVARLAPMTVAWSAYAQSLTDKPVKGMLTGPVTILQWSFVRDDQPRAQTCRQIALALRDEVLDLEKAGIRVIQIDEPAFREGLPLRHDRWTTYLDWAVDSFKLTTSGVQDDTQIHTHMCYSEFNDIIEAIAAMDADVITIETSRSNMELLGAFEAFAYPNDIGPGVYDIHSPNVPKERWMVDLMHRAAQRLPAERLWVNPDCGLKTRGWPETREALAAMVHAAHSLREAA